jgi:hypothetical protein
MRRYSAISVGLLVASAILCTNAHAETAPSDIEAFIRKVSETCSGIAAKAKDPKVFDYCVVEMMRPIVRGRSCIAFAAGMRDPGYRCDAKGTLFYETAEITPTAPMTKEQFGDAFGEVISKYARKSAATCLLANENKADVVACLSREKGRLHDISMDCATTKFAADNDALLLRALDNCIEYKLKLQSSSH